MNRKSKKPRVLIDVDGVLRDFIGGLKEVYLREFPGHEIKPVISRNLEEFFPLGKEIYEFMDKHHAWEILANAPPYPGAIEALQRWEDVFEIVIVTAQPPQGRHPTLLWLAKHRVPTNEIHITFDKELIPGVALLDDFVDNLESFASTDRLAVCLDQPWNKEWNGPRVKSVDEFFNLVSDFLNPSKQQDDILLA